LTTGKKKGETTRGAGAETWGEGCFGRYRLAVSLKKKKRDAGEDILKKCADGEESNAGVAGRPSAVTK